MIYRCYYVNDIEADSEEEAAIEFYRIMQDDGESIRPIVNVSDPEDYCDLHGVEIDTDELEFNL